MNQYEDKGQVFVHLGEDSTPLFIGSPVVVYTDGKMTALYIYTPTLSGEVIGTFESYFLLTDADGGQFRINTSDETNFDTEVAAGNKVIVYHNEAMTNSLPPQVFGIGSYILRSEPATRRHPSRVVPQAKV